jgi:thiosulfate dehydrogenase [quinone] large subunit
MQTTDHLNSPSKLVEALPGPQVLEALFHNVTWSWVWLILRLWLGVEWVLAGLSKIGNPAWTGSEAGAALIGFIHGLLDRTSDSTSTVQSWYTGFLEGTILPNAALWSNLIAWAELLIGVILVLGFFTWIASFLSGVMSFNYLLAGVIGLDPYMLLVAILLLLAWRTAGWLGLDRWMMPAVGVPWKPGYLFERSDPGEVESPEDLNGFPPPAR